MYPTFHTARRKFITEQKEELDLKGGTRQIGGVTSLWPAARAKEEVITHLAMQSTSIRTVPFHHEDRQWDARFNVQQDGDLDELVGAIKRDWDSGKLKYVLVGGPEVGTRSYQDDYQIRHVHVAAIFNNRTSKRAILKNWNVKQGNGYYLVPRNRDLPYKDGVITISNPSARFHLKNWSSTKLEIYLKTPSAKESKKAKRKRS